MSDCLVCQCTFESSECVHFLGRGTSSDPYEPMVQTDPEGLAVCSPSGLGVFLPPPLDNPPAVMVHPFGTQTIQAKTTQIVFWGGPLYDTDGMFDEDAPSRLTINAPGLYQIEAFQPLGAIGSLPLQSMVIRKNAVDYLGRWSLNAIMGPLVVQDQFQAGDYVEVLVTNHSSGNNQLSSPAEGTTDPYIFRFTAQFLRVL